MSTNDLQALTAEFRLADGSVCQAVRRDDAIRLVIWGSDEDPLRDWPWIVASVAPDGSVETFGDLPGRKCTHHAAEGGRGKS